MGLNRRQLLAAAAAAGAGAGAAVAPFGVRLGGAVASAQAAFVGVSFDAAPFTLGVASGDPTASSVMLWTRLAPEPLTDGDGGLDETVEVAWVVAEDPRLRRIVKTGTTPATSALAHSVHVDVTGLEPGRTYWYRFAALGRVSRIGRTRTAPAPGAARLRVGYVSCANFQHGEFAAYRHLAREDLDVVFCLGDYQYEYTAGEYAGYREHQAFETVTLEQYRQRTALYKGDPALRAAHAAFPWVVAWDDHEVDNDWASDTPESTDPAQSNESPEAFRMRRARAFQSYYEHMPVRLPDVAQVGSPDVQIYRDLAFGDLLDVSVVDTRQYRSDQPCGGQEPGFIVVSCQEQDDADRTILGAQQKDWLKGALSGSQAAWRMVANQVMFSPLYSTSLAALPLDQLGLPVPIPAQIPAPTGSNGQYYFNVDQWGRPISPSAGRSRPSWPSRRSPTPSSSPATSTRTGCTTSRRTPTTTPAGRSSPPSSWARRSPRTASMTS